MKQSEFLVITSNLLNGREKSRSQAAIGFGFASQLTREFLANQLSNRNGVITFGGHLKTALSW